MALDRFRSKSEPVSRPLVRLCMRLGVTPNQLTVASLGLALLAGVLYGLAYPDFNLLLLAFLAVFANSALDLTDGALARATKAASPRGDFLDHIADRYADLFLLCGITFGGFLPPAWGLVTVAGVLLASYVGTQAQAVTSKRHYGGFMGRADRLVVLMVATLVTVIYPWNLAVGGLSLTILGWGMLAIGLASHATAVQRIVTVWRQL